MEAIGQINQYLCDCSGGCRAAVSTINLHCGITPPGFECPVCYCTLQSQRYRIVRQNQNVCRINVSPCWFRPSATQLHNMGGDGLELIEMIWKGRLVLAPIGSVIIEPDTIFPGMSEIQFAESMGRRFGNQAHQTIKKWLDV